MATTASHNSASHDAAPTVGAATQEQAVPQGPNGVDRSSGASSILLPCICAVDDNGASAPALDPCPRHSPEAVVELDLSLQTLGGTPALHALINLQAANIAFNKLKGAVPDVSSNPRLVYLNISHNHINLLEGLTLAPSLRVLNAGHNRIVSLAALRGCAQLEELWLHRNNIVSLREVEHLADLDNLRTVMLQGNPFCKTINKDDATSYVIDMVPSVELLNLSGAVVAATASARAVAGKFVRSQAAATLVRELNEAAQDMAKEFPQFGTTVRPLHFVHQERMKARRRRRGDDDTASVASGMSGRTSASFGTAATSASTRARQRVARAARSPGGPGSPHAKQPPSRPKYVAKTESELAGATISSAMDTLPDLASKVEKTRKPRPKARKPAAARRTRARPIPGQASTAATPRPVAAPAPAPGEASPQASRTATARAKSQALQAPAPAPTPKKLAAAAPTVADTQAGSSNAGAGRGAGAGATSSPSPSKAPVGVSGGPRALGIGATAMAQASTASILDALPNVLPGEWAVRYRKSTTEAVHIRADGGASAKWPSGSRAVSVDVDRDPEGGSDAKLYRMFVMSESGTMIVNFDQLGAGQISSATGQTIISSSTDGSGFRSNSKGLVIARWNSDGKVSTETVRNMDPADPLARNPARTRIPVRVNDSLGIVYDVSSRSVEVWFQRQGVRHKFIQGHNPARPTTEPPPAEFAPSAKSKRASPGNQRKQRSPAGKPRQSAAQSPSGGLSGPASHAQTLADIRAAVSSL